MKLKIAPDIDKILTDGMRGFINAVHLGMPDYVEMVFRCKNSKNEFCATCQTTTWYARNNTSITRMKHVLEFCLPFDFESLVHEIAHALCNTANPMKQLRKDMDSHAADWGACYAASYNTAHYAPTIRVRQGQIDMIENGTGKIVTYTF